MKRADISKLLTFKDKTRIRKLFARRETSFHQYDPSLLKKVRINNQYHNQSSEQSILIKPINCPILHSLSLRKQGCRNITKILHDSYKKSKVKKLLQKIRNIEGSRSTLIKTKSTYPYQSLSKSKKIKIYPMFTPRVTNSSSIHNMHT
ncbi:unnamed protein product [Moneuplotes crassus]|uniref:Uncharacterized protein n=1 Tax=Euplotes crassus TaxID=5936 RepID=A0AAD1XVP5_EUPCR|nr:unnamed protein product [Moneuplotes crassus]